MTDESSSQDAFPEADVHGRQSVGQAIRRSGSKLWLVTLLCVIVTIVLVIQATRSQGKQIVVRFQQGHGIKPGDMLRHRGIDVGQVTQVGLTDDLSRAEIKIVLEPAATGLAREGSRFWIERPQLGLARISGLETVVGAKYVGVIPGPEDAKPLTVFDGQENPPPTTEFIEGGLEVVLQGAQRRSVQRGSPVSYRGLKVGHVVSMGLASDAATVEVHAYIYPAYKQLVRTNTMFWSNSGIDVEFGVTTGFKLSAETLATVVAGGVAFSTPDPPDSPATTGHRFTLNRKAEDEWLTWQPRIPIGAPHLPDGLVLPDPVRVSLQWRETTLVITRQRQRQGWALLTGDGRLLGPRDLLTVPAAAVDSIATVEVEGGELPALPSDTADNTSLARLDVTDSTLTVATWPPSRLRTPTALEDCLLVSSFADLALPIEASRLSERDEVSWSIDPSFVVTPSMHGAVVVAVSDGSVVGMVVVDKGQASIAFVTAE